MQLVVGVQMMLQRDWSVCRADDMHLNMPYTKDAPQGKAWEGDMSRISTSICYPLLYPQSEAEGLAETRGRMSDMKSDTTQCNAKCDCTAQK